MAAVDDIKSRLDLDQIAGILGTDRDTADSAVDEALTQLVGTMGGQASDPDAAAGMTKAALKDHMQTPAYGDTIDLNAVDTADGEKIVGHVMAPDQIQALGGSAGGGLLQKLLPILAPIVMGYLASRLSGMLQGGAAAGGAAGQGAGAPQGGGGLGDLLGGLLGGGSGGAQGGGGLDDILGGLLGGGQQGQYAPEQPAGQAPSTGGPFQTPGQPQVQAPAPSAPTGELRVDESTGMGTSPQPQTQYPQAGPAGGLGDLLKDILLGGGR